MKKKIFVILIVFTLIIPSFAIAQSTIVSNQQVITLIGQAINLIQQLITKLQSQLIELNTASQITESTSEEIETSNASSTSKTTQTERSITIDKTFSDYQITGTDVDDKYLAQIKLKAKKNISLAKIIYHTSPTDSSNEVLIEKQETIRSINKNGIVTLNDVKKSIKMKDLNNNWVNIVEHFDIEEATATSNGEDIKIEF
ncbi:MAG: hypothetical protein JW740_02255 [Candidatus Zambryskibacteria bacterium]|nr:hypothetical protein [Candidatus Zambryskibacteria bacterium]